MPGRWGGTRGSCQGAPQQLPRSHSQRHHTTQQRQPGCTPSSPSVHPKHAALAQGHRPQKASGQRGDGKKDGLPYSPHEALPWDSSAGPVSGLRSYTYDLLLRCREAQALTTPHPSSPA